MKPLKNYGFAIFWMVATADLLLITLEMEEYRYLTKPLLMPLLLLIIFSRTKSNRHRTSKILVVTALVMATAGDILLLKTTSNNYFVAGLVCFLLMQLSYAIYFLRIKAFTTSHFVSIFSSFLLMGFISASVIYLLWNRLGEFRIPIIIYSAFLSFMFTTAVNVLHFRVTNKLAIEAFIPGAVLFVMSDFILASNLFYFQEAFIGIAIMATYCGAQYYLARGFIKHLR